MVDEDEPFVFTNVYKPGGSIIPNNPYDPEDPYKPSSPHTADEGVSLWIGLLCISTIGLASVVLAMLRRKRA